MSYKRKIERKYFCFGIILSVFLISSTIIYSISNPTSIKDHNSYDKSTDPNIFNNSLVGTSMIILINNTQIYPGEVYNVDIGELLNITVFFSDNNSNPLMGAIINLTRGGITYNLTEDVLKNQYFIILNTSNPGLEVMVVSAWLAGYESQFFAFLLETAEISTSIYIFLNKVNVTSDPTIELPIGDLLNITVKYLDISNQHVEGATIEFIGGGFSDVLNENSSFDQYSYILNTTQFNIGVNFFTLTASKINYQTQSLNFFVNLIEKFTSIHLFINGVNATGYPLLEFPIGELLNITVKYLDINNQHIQGATIELISEGFSDFLIENSSFNQYSYILNSTLLQLGANIIFVIASKINYQSQNAYSQIFVRRIRINISGNSLIEVLAGETIHIEIELNNEDFGGPIVDATVTYLWVYGQGILTDLNSDGIYEVNLTTIMVGVYNLEIIAYKGANYEVESFQLTIIITNPIELFILSSSADIPDLDGTFYLVWITSEYADNYSIYVYSSKITQINSSVILYDAHVYDSPYLISGLSNGIYYYVVIAFNEYGNVSSNCIQVIVSRNFTKFTIPGYNLFTLIVIISVFSVIIIKKKLGHKNKPSKTTLVDS
ncbi:MAG: hypothetical protein ACFFEN_09580 [Candidatus Thorarchaeota archaeon]